MSLTPSGRAMEWKGLLLGALFILIPFKERVPTPIAALKVTSIDPSMETHLLQGAAGGEPHTACARLHRVLFAQETTAHKPPKDLAGTFEGSGKSPVGGTDNPRP